MEPIQLVEIVAQVCQVKPDQVQLRRRRATHFQTNHLFDAWAGPRRLIIKEYVQPAWQANNAQREFSALQRLQGLNFAPQPLFYHSDTGPVILYEFMPGQAWGRRKPCKAKLNQLAEAWIAMNASPGEASYPVHSFSVPLDQLADLFSAGLQSYLTWTQANFLPGQSAAQACLEILELCRTAFRELGEYSPVLCFTRSDGRFANILNRPEGNLGMVDWEDSGSGDPAFSAADLMTHSNQEDLLSWEEWGAFLEPYTAYHSQADATFSRRVQLYQLILVLFWLSTLTRYGMRLSDEDRLSGWQVNGIDANTRLLRYLARAQAWPLVNFSGRLASLEQVAFFPVEKT